ncbi:MAG: hydrolase, partial [Flavobacteriaceae bacterium]
YNQQFTYLVDGFNPSGKEEAKDLEADSEYSYGSVRFQYQSNPQELFSFNTQLDLGEFFSGNRYSFEHRMTLRIQPKVNLGFNTNFDHIALPEDYGMANILLLSPRIEYTFNRSVFWSTLIQYSNQRDNLGINSRLQWRFAPLSDLFLVYNDNYFTTTWGPRGRSINLKLTYWLNI